MASFLPSIVSVASHMRGARQDLGRIARREPSGPWFRGHPRAAAAVIAVSSAAVLVIQILDSRGSDAIALLYALPIGLAAVTFGMRGGLVAAIAAYLAFVSFALFSNADQAGTAEWVTRAVAMFLLAGLLGRASDQSERAARMALANQRQRLIVEEQNRRYSEGIELSDSILQHVAAAKWAIEQGDQAKAAQLLTQALTSGQEMLSDLLPSRSAVAHPVDRPVGDPAMASVLRIGEAPPDCPGPGLATSA